MYRLQGGMMTSNLVQCCLNGHLIGPVPVLLGSAEIQVHSSPRYLLSSYNMTALGQALGEQQVKIRNSAYSCNAIS